MPIPQPPTKPLTAEPAVNPEDPSAFLVRFSVKLGKRLTKRAQSAHRTKGSLVRQGLTELLDQLDAHDEENQPMTPIFNALRQRTVIQTFGPDDTYQQLLTLEGVTLALDPFMPLTIDGTEYTVVGRRSVDIETGKRLLTTTITVDLK